MGRLANWLRTDYKPGESLPSLCDHQERNRINNILQDIVGIGCRIEKPTNDNGRGWKIIFDGSSDEDPTPLGGPASGGETTPYHFQTEYLSDDYVTVRGGLLELFCGNSRRPVSLTCDGGIKSEIVTAKATIAHAGNGTNYVVLTKDSANNPANLTVACSLIEPTALDKTTRKIAHFTVSGSKVQSATIIQDWRGGNIREFWAAPDTYSINYGSEINGSRLQLAGYETAAGSTPDPDTALFPYRIDANNLGYAGKAGLAAMLATTFSQPGHTHVWDDLTNVDKIANGGVGYIPAIASGNATLEWIDPETLALHTWDSISDAANIQDGSAGDIPCISGIGTIVWTTISANLQALGGANLAGMFADGLFTNIDSYSLVTILAPTELNGPLHSITLLGKVNGVA